MTQRPVSRSGDAVPVAVDRLSAAQQAAVRALAARVAAADGAEPLSDQTRLALSTPAAVVTHLLALDGPDLVGYGQLDTGGDVPAAEFAIAPGPRHDVVTVALFEAAEHRSEPGRLLVWAHGAASPVNAVAHRRGYTRDRVLLQLARPAAAAVPAPAAPAGVRLRAFVPGRDETAWLRVNARAFAQHREQGGWTIADLLVREAEDWFAPAGFLLAVDETDRPLGFHWTKLHPPSPVDAQLIGEVYVIAVDPDAQGRGLGPWLLSAGLAHLTGRGATRFVLYTDEDNAAAARLYERFGFTPSRSDVQYRRPGPAVQSGAGSFTER